MPLTIAHPAAILPLRRSRLPLSALVVGSLAPDLEYLLHLSPTGHVGHTFIGLFIFCIPVGLLGLLLWHRVWREPAHALLGFQRDIDPFTFLPAKRPALVCLAILLGALTHVAWDSFTHSYGWMVQHVPALSSPLLDTRWGILRPYKLLQHLSTASGLAILAVVAFPSLRNIPAKGLAALAALLTTSAVGGIIVAINRLGWPDHFETIRVSVGVAVVSSFLAFIVVATVAGIVWREHR